MYKRKQPPTRHRFRLPPWLAPALMMCVMAPVALSQDAGAPPAATAPAGTEVEAQVTRTADKSLLQWFKDGGMFMYPIALCSVLAVGIVIERLLTVRTGQVAPAGFVPGLKSAMGNLDRDREAGLGYCRSQDHALARVVASGIRRAPRGIDAIEKAMEDQGASEAIRLRRNMRFLYAIASVSTLLGLIGTIQGMIEAFQTAEVVGTGKFGPLASGIYKALITTFAGLLVAIPVTVAYYYLAGRIERIVGILNDEAGAFLDHYTSGASATGEASIADAPLTVDVAPPGAGAMQQEPAPAPLSSGQLAPGAWS